MLYAFFLLSHFSFSDEKMQLIPTYMRMYNVCSRYLIIFFANGTKKKGGLYEHEIIMGFNKNLCMTWNTCHNNASGVYKLFDFYSCKMPT